MIVCFHWLYALHLFSFLFFWGVYLLIVFLEIFHSVGFSDESRYHISCIKYTIQVGWTLLTTPTGPVTSASYVFRWVAQSNGWASTALESAGAHFLSIKFSTCHSCKAHFEHTQVEWGDVTKKGWWLVLFLPFDIPSVYYGSRFYEFKSTHFLVVEVNVILVRLIWSAWFFDIKQHAFVY